MLYFFSTPPSFGVPSAVCCGSCCVGGGSFSSNINSSKNRIIASTSGVAQPLGSGAPPRCLFRSPSCLNRFCNGGEYTSSCKTAFAKHMLPLFTSPRARRCGSAALQVGPEGVVPSRKARSPAFCKRETRRWRRGGDGEANDGRRRGQGIGS